MTAARTRFCVPVAAVAVLIAVAGIAVALSSGGSSTPEAAAPTVSSTTAIDNARTPPAPYTPIDLLRSEYGRIYATAASGDAAGGQVLVATFGDLSRTTAQVIVWQEGGETTTQVFAVSDQGDALFGNLTSENSAVVQAVQQRRGGQRELGIVYDATAYGSSSPTARVALLRLEGEAWRVVWDAGGTEGWRGSHGRVEFPNGDLSELVVHSDSFSEGADELSGVLFEANAGPHRQFVDIWVRDDDAYTRESAETVPSAYATLVEFLYALGTDDVPRAQALVTEAELVQTAQSFGLDGALGNRWLITCDLSDCGTQTGPIGFYAGPPVQVFFEQRDGRTLIGDIQPAAP